MEDSVRENKFQFGFFLRVRGIQNILFHCYHHALILLCIDCIYTQKCNHLQSGEMQISFQFSINV